MQNVLTTRNPNIGTVVWHPLNVSIEKRICLCGWVGNPGETRSARMISWSGTFSKVLKS